MNICIKFNILWDSLNEIPFNKKGEGKSFRACIHSGNAGDIIYSLPTVRELVANHYVINLCADPGFHGRNIDFSTARALAPLLLAQPYIERVTIVSGNLPLEYLDQPIDGIEFNLDKFRLHEPLKHHLAISHAMAFGLHVNLYEKWLYLDTEKSDRDYIVVSLTPRYRSLPKEYWLEALAGLDNIIVLGIPEEFHCVSGVTADFVTCDDFLQMAKIIQGGKLFIGNPNLPYAIAEGLKVQRIVELPKEPQNAYPIGKSGHIAPSAIREARELISRLLSDSESTRYYEHITLGKEISLLESIIRDKDTHISNLESAIREKDVHIGNLETHVKNLEVAIRGKDTHIENLEIAVKDKDNHINNLETHIINVELHVRNLETAIRDKDTHIQNIESILNEKDTILNNIYKSRGWKALSIYYRLKHKILHG